MHSGYGVKPGEHVPGEPMRQYLEDYAKIHGLSDRMTLNTRVTAIERLHNEGDDGATWRLSCRSRRYRKETAASYSIDLVMITRKLILATGVTNEPNQLKISGETEFDAPIVHSAGLGRKATRLLQDSTIKRVAVLGGGKSAYDAVYMFASAGKEVKWIIRRSGRGTNWVLPAHTKLLGFEFWRAVFLPLAAQRSTTDRSSRNY
jgi:cation diffusion facilitator CzcD-associated flavoprotein CzcO